MPLFSRRPLSAAACLLFTSALYASPVPVHWFPCPESWVGSPSGTLGTRLQCGSVQAPLDHVSPDGRSMEIGFIRIQAARPLQREGALFFNKGGPGGHPGRLLRSMAEGWSEVDPDDPDDGDKRRLAERYDLVGVIPRGLVGSEPVQCVNGLPPRHAFLPTNQDDANWAVVQADAQEVVDACTAPAIAHARFINTEQHVHDMDMVRRALGDEQLNFYGISYGGKVGAWYAAMYPTHTGRVLLDSSMDFAHDYRAALHLSLAAKQRAFDDDVLAPVLREPARYGLGTSADDVALAVDTLPALARARWAGHLDSPARLAAALRLADWLQSSAPPTDLSTLARLIRRAVFSNEGGLDARIRWEANQLAGALYAAPPSAPSFALGPDGDSVRIITACNDAHWTRSEQDMRESARRYAASYLQFNGSQILEELTCTRWGGQRARHPDLSPLGQIGPFLLIQSEKDIATPLTGSRYIVDRFANARMLLVRGSSLHGVFNFTRSACIDRTAAHYLLTGVLPEARSRIFSCADSLESPIDVPPGTPRPTTTPVPVDDLPPHDHQHDEF